MTAELKEIWEAHKSQCDRRATFGGGGPNGGADYIPHAMGEEMFAAVRRDGHGRAGGRLRAGAGAFGRMAWLGGPERSRRTHQRGCGSGCLLLFMQVERAVAAGLALVSSGSGL